MKDSTGRGIRLEALPEAVAASMEIRDAWRRSAAHSADGLEFLVADLARWPAGATLRVAFLGGSDQLHRDIAEATRQITDTCNVFLDFGEAGGSYRRWSESDTAYAAEIRVSFDEDGYFSLVGTDSTDRTIGSPDQRVGGRPGQRSMNFGGWTDARPDDWAGTVRHEFLHALSFQHAHQNDRGPCQDAFRWDDDAGYQPTRDAHGRFVPDQRGRRPGIYTYLAGAPNFWSRNTVDRNLRQLPADEVVAGPFDSESVMLYTFEPFFYRTDPSPCAPTGNGVDLSDGDRLGLRLLYPVGAEAEEARKRARAALDALGAGLESASGTRSGYLERVIELYTERA